jgi:putative membrane protein
MMWGGGHMDGWGAWLLMAVFMVLVWGSIIAFGIWLARSMGGHAQAAPGSAALDIARDRYARGEISDEEFERIKRGLSH